MLVRFATWEQNTTGRQRCSSGAGRPVASVVFRDDVFARSRQDVQWRKTVVAYSLIVPARRCGSTVIPRDFGTCNPCCSGARKCFHTLSKIISRFDAEMISHFHGWTANTLAKSSIWPLAQGIELRRVKVMSLGFANCATESL